MQVPGMSDGRYCDAVEDVIYLTAGHWPANPPSSLSAVEAPTSTASRTASASAGKVEMGAEAGVAANGDYAGSI